MIKTATYLLTFSLGVLALHAFQGAPPTPSWVGVVCADGSPCIVTPTDSYEGLAFAIQWLMPDPQDPAGTALPWVECPAPAPGVHPQTTCIGGSAIAHWIVLTRGGPAHATQAVDHDVFAVTNSPIYGPGRGLSQPVPQPYALGAVMGFGLPANAIAPQAPPVPPGDPAAWSTYLDSWCLTNPTCGSAGGGGAMTQAQFDALLSASPFATAVHPFSFAITRGEALDGDIIIGMTGPPQ